MRKNSHLTIFALPGNEEFARSLTALSGAGEGAAEIRSFPDGESYVRILSDVQGKIVVPVCSLHHPNEQILPLYFLGRAAKKLGARHVCVIAPYLGYMRQDKVFQPGEAVTSEYFAELVCSFAGSIVTADPHLHRRDSLSEIYPIPNQTVHAAGRIAEWVKNNLERPVLIGPDAESEQWVAEVAQKAGAPFIVLEKVRHGDREVEVSAPQLKQFENHTPVLVDDIISTARTMIETVRHLKNLKMKKPVCIGVHAVFAENAERDLLEAGAEKIVTCNTIPHASNAIDVSGLFVDFIAGLK